MKNRVLCKQEELNLSTTEFEEHLKKFQQENAETIPVILRITHPKEVDKYDEMANNRIVNMKPYGNSKMSIYSFYKAISMSIQDDNQ